MEHLVEGHLGGYWIDYRDPNDITSYCEECGDSDWILLSWEDGHMMEALVEYFSSLKNTKEIITRDCEGGITKPEAIQHILYQYQSDKYIINELLEDNVLTEEEGKTLLKVSFQAQKEQIALACEVYPKGKSLIKKKKENK